MAAARGGAGRLCKGLVKVGTLYLGKETSMLWCSAFYGLEVGSPRPRCVGYRFLGYESGLYALQVGFHALEIGGPIRERSELYAFGFGVRCLGYRSVS